MSDTSPRTSKTSLVIASLVSTTAAFAAGIGLGRGGPGDAVPAVDAAQASAEVPAQVEGSAPEPRPEPAALPQTHAERAQLLLEAFEQDTPQSYTRAYLQSEGDPLARAESALLLHYRYGPRRARLDQAKALLASLREREAAPASAADEPVSVRRVLALAALAEGELDAALTLLPPETSDPRAALYRAWVQLERGELNSARAAAELALRARPEQRAAALALLSIEFAASRETGLAALREAAEAHPEHAALADTLLCAARGQVLSLANEADTNSPEAARLSRRADLAQAEGRTLEAARLRARAYASDEAKLPHAKGSGFPDFDPAREQVLYGRLLASATPVAASALHHGEFVEHEGLLGRVEDPAVPNAFWLANGSLASVSDGLARFRVSPGRAPDLGLMFRVQAPERRPEDWELLSGYEITFTPKRARLVRWDRGVAKSLAASVAIDGLSNMTELEVVVYLVGPQIVATIYSGQKLQLLATLSARDTTYASGQTGYRAGVLQRGGGLSLLSVMDRERAEPSGVGQRERHGSLYLRGRDADATPFGPKRYAFIPAAQVEALPAGLRRPSRPRGQSVEEGVEHAVVELTTVEAERLRRSTMAITAIDGNAPWGAFHPAYLAQRDQPPVATKRGFDLDLSYKNAQMVEEILRAYQARYPEISELVELGRSHEGRPLWALEISANPRAREDKPAVLIAGTFHAGELLSTEFSLDVVAGLLEGYGRVPRVTRWVDELELWVMPMVNPDGNLAFMERSMWANRKNGRDVDGDGQRDPFEGVDLNRNYPFGWGLEGSQSRFTGQSYRGPSVASEPETQALMALAEAEHFTAALSFHTRGRAIFVPYLVDHSRDPRVNVAKLLAQELVEAAPEQRDGKPYVVRPNGYAVSGCDQDWLMHAHGTAALLLEGAYQNPPLDTRKQAVTNTRPVWETLLERVRAGPRISGHVRDPEGRPIEHASVMVAELKLRADERWTARARDGRFDRLLNTGGRYTLRVEAPGYEPIEQIVRVGGGPVDVELTLQPLGS